jgi:hypothetical protein
MVVIPSETSALTRATSRHIPHDGFLSNNLNVQLLEPQISVLRVAFLVWIHAYGGPYYHSQYYRAIYRRWSLLIYLMRVQTESLVDVTHIYK